MAIAEFSYILWSQRYPELASAVSPELGEAYFAEAGQYLDNTDASRVTDLARRGLLLNMLVAHIASMNAPINGAAPSALVGRITSASEGSVSVSVGGVTAAGSAEWFALTRYGLAFWWATQWMRSARYVPGYPPVFGPRTYPWR